MAILIDSNILVYSYLKEYEYLRALIISESSFVSEISRVEVLGYHKLTSEEETYFSDVFNFIPILSPAQEVFDKAIQLRKKHHLKLGDSIIAATATVYKLNLYTRNTIDFKQIPGLKCINPLK